MRPILAMLLLAGCSSVAPVTAARLAAADPLTTDPGGIEVAVTFPAGLAAQPGSARLEAKASRGDQQIANTFWLKERQGRAQDAPAGSRTVIYHLAPKDAALMRAWQARVAEWKAEGNANGSLDLGIAGCAAGDGPGPDATGSVLIRMGPGQPFLPLIQNARLGDLLGPEVLSALGPCAGPV